MLSLFKKKQKDPEGLLFPIRATQFDFYASGIVYVIDNEVVREVPLNSEEAFVFLKSDGRTQIQKMAEEFPAKSDGPDAGSNYDRVIKIVHDLLDRKIIRMLKRQQNLAYYLELPMSRLDKEKAIRLMKRDGFLPS